LKSNSSNKADIPHIASTYTALCILRMCGIDMNETNIRLKKLYNKDEITIDKQFLLLEIKKSQLESGNVSCQSWDTESDVRFLYCACAIHALLGIDDNSEFEIDVDGAREYLDSLVNYEGGFSMVADGESNGDKR
jgi:geranylgeranyl transferase type-1 subunit beta